MTSQAPPPGEVPSHAAPNKGLHTGFALAATAVLFVPFLIDAIHAGPASDDFCYAAQYGKSGFLGAIEHYYNNVNGRFFATFVIVALDFIFPIGHAYAAIPLIFLASIAMAFLALVWALASILAPRALDWRGKSALGLLSALILISNTEKLSEIFYWLSASATYVSAATGTSIALACMLMLMRADIGRFMRLLPVALGSLASVAAAGSFEASGPVIMAGGVFCVLITRILRRPGGAGIVFVAAAAALGLWLNLSSLGTATRAGVIELDAGKDLIGLIAIAIRSFLWTAERLGTWGSRASVWVLALAFSWAFREQLLVDWKKDARRRRVTLAAFAGLAALTYLAVLPMFYAYGTANPVRAHFLADIFSMIFWLAVLSFAFANFGKALAVDLSGINRRRLSVGLFAALFVTIAGTGNFNRATLDIVRGFAFSRQAAAQIRDVLDNPDRAREVVVARNVTAYAPTLSVSDIDADPRRWRNVCFAEHLGAYGVRVEPIEDSKPKPKGWKTFMPKGWVDPDPQAIGRPRPVWPLE